MKRFVLGLCVALALVLAGGPSATGGSAVEMVSVIVTLRDQADLKAIRQGKKAKRRLAVVKALKAKAAEAQGPLTALLEVRRRESKVARVTLLWIFNGLAVQATPDVVAELAARPEVGSVTPDRTIPAPAGAASHLAAEPNVDLVNAPDLWALGYRGQGVVVANMDTGVDSTHPDLAARWRGGANSWYDPNGQHPTTPTDVNGHGTWTMGVIVGGEAGGSAIGVAPDAQWIAVKIFNDAGSATTSGIHQGFQWLLDPDGNPQTDDAPDVVNNSWTLSAPGCSLAFQPDLQALRAAGIVPVFAAGNFGPGSSTSTSPGNNPEAFAVGATSNTDAIYSSSSRGPSACGEPQTTFPELVAPGVDVRTSDLYGLYAYATGTSLAAPHVAGALALLLSASPELTADEQETALETGAVDLGSAGPDDTYGSGRLDVLAAYTSLGSPQPSFTLAATPTSASTAAGGSVVYTVTVSPQNGFAADVSLAASGLPSGATSTFTPPSIAGGSGTSQLTVTTSPSVAAGSYPLTITGTSGALVRTAPVTLVVTAPPPDVALSATPPSATTLPGTSVTYTVSVTRQNGFTGSVALSLGGLTTSQATWTFTPTTVTGSGTSQLKVTPKSSLAAGSYPLTITGTSGALVRTASVTLNVWDFTVSVAPSSQTVAAGGSASYTVTVSSVNGFAGTVILSVKGLPAGATATFSPASVAAPGTSTLTVQTTGSTPRGTFTLTVSGKSGKTTRKAKPTLVVT